MFRFYFFLLNTIHWNLPLSFESTCEDKSSLRNAGTFDSSTTFLFGILIGTDIFDGDVDSHHPFGGLIATSTHSFSKLCKSPKGALKSLPAKKPANVINRSVTSHFFTNLISDLWVYLYLELYSTNRTQE